MGWLPRLGSPQPPCLQILLSKHSLGTLCVHGLGPPAEGMLSPQPGVEVKVFSVENHKKWDGTKGEQENAVGDAEPV